MNCVAGEEEEMLRIYNKWMILCAHFLRFVLIRLWCFFYFAIVAVFHSHCHTFPVISICWWIWNDEETHDIPNQTKPKIYVFKYEKSKPGFAIFSQALFLSVWGFVFSGACRMCLESVFRKRMRTSAWICVCLQLNAFVISVCTFYFHKIHKISVIILHRIQHSFHFGTVSLFVKCKQCSPIDIYTIYSVIHAFT